MRLPVSMRRQHVEVLRIGYRLVDHDRLRWWRLVRGLRRRGRTAQDGDRLVGCEGRRGEEQQERQQPRHDDVRLIASLSQRAMPVTCASSCCWPITWTPTGRPPTLISGTVTTGANSIEDGALNTKSPVGRAASGWPGTSPDQSGAGPGQESVIAASAIAAAAACASCACWRANSPA